MPSIVISIGHSASVGSAGAATENLPVGTYLLPSFASVGAGFASEQTSLLPDDILQLPGREHNLNKAERQSNQ